MVTRTLTADDLEFESFVNYDDDELAYRAGG